MLEAVEIRKRFETIVALDGVSVAIVPGQFRALLGGNGSGKSTLAKTIMGTIRPDSGRILIDGEPTHIRGPKSAFNAGLDATYQELSLLQHLSVRENLELHAVQAGKPVTPDQLATLLALLGLERLEPVMVRDIDLGDRHLIELAKALLTEPRFLILDEITSALRRDQVLVVEKALAQLRERDIGLLVISHRLDEIREFCDTVTVLRDGKVTLDGELKDESLADLLDAMTGSVRVMPLASEAKESLDGAQHVVVKEPASSSVGEPEKPDASPPRLEVVINGEHLIGRAGEVVGLAGLAGQGQSELLRRIFGAIKDPLPIRLEGKEMINTSPREGVAHGFGFLSGDRENEMAFRQRSTRENLLVGSWASHRVLDVASALERLRLTIQHLSEPMSSLSGGTQQKVAVARTLGIAPLVVLADDPTRGVDVQTRAEIHAWLAELARSGALVLFSSSDDSEFVGLCHRVYVLHAGSIVALLEGDDVNESTIARAELALVAEHSASSEDETSPGPRPTVEVAS